MWWAWIVACTPRDGTEPPPTDRVVDTDTGTPPDDTAPETPDHTGTVPTTTGHTGGETTVQDRLEYEALFDATVIHTVDLVLDEASWALAVAGTADELDALITLDGRPLDGGALRIRGDAAVLGWTGKANLELDLDDAGGTRVGNVERLTLNAQLDDPACAREVLAAEVMRAAGVRAPRAVYATVTVQGEPAGLYTLVEGVDRSFVRLRWADEDGDLWVGGDGVDFSGPGLDEWSPVGEPGDRAKLAAVRDVVQTSEAFEEDLEPLVDLPDLHRTWAWVAAVGHGRGWPHDLDNIFAYADPGNGGRLHFVPWKMERAWELETQWGLVDSQLAIRCRYDAECEAAVRAAVALAADEVEALDVPAMAEALFALSEPAVIADPARPVPLPEVAAARDTLRLLVAGWPGKVRADLALP